jgi:3-hydroxyisobutyrate dehydrogenase-like beta-hydroxyacid dehydrogenase
MPKKSRKNVGLIGLGIIGSRVANALRAEGFHVYVWNRTPQAAPNFLASPRQVAELCDIIQIFVADAQALFDVLDSMGEVLTPSHIILCNSTVGPEATLEAARIVRERGAQFLDAPFTGSKTAAETRELVYYIGGSDKTLQLAEPVLKASSRAIVKIGKIGDAAVVKVATNMISAVTVQTLAEAYAIVKGSGIDPVALSEALKHHAVRSGITDAKLTKMLDRQYEPHFSLKHMFKDVQLGIHIANSLDIDLPATTSTAGVMYGGLTRGWADDDFSVLARAYQKEDAPKPLAAPLPPTPHESVLPERPKEILPALAPQKREPPRELTADELRNVGIIVPEPPAAEKAPLVAEKVAPVVEESAKETVVAKDDSAGNLPKAEPVNKTAAASAEPAAASAAPAGASAAPAGASAEAAQPHTPFVRIRRWFGTGSPN